MGTSRAASAGRGGGTLADTLSNPGPYQLCLRPQKEIGPETEGKQPQLTARKFIPTRIPQEAARLALPKLTQEIQLRWPVAGTRQEWALGLGGCHSGLCVPRSPDQ